MSQPALSDLDVYRQLSIMADTLDQMSAEAESLVGETALQTAAISVRGMAQVVRDHTLGEAEGGVH